MNEIFMRTGLDNDMQIDHDIALVRASFLFDADWYLRHYPEVAALGLDPAEHYCTTGWWLGYMPSLQFNVRDAMAPTDQNPLVHALRHLTLRNSAFDRQIDGRANASFHPCPEPSFEKGGRGNSTHVGPGIIVHPADHAMLCRFDGTVAVHLHLFYMEMALDFRHLLDAIPVPFDLFVSVPSTSEVIAAEAAFAEIENVRRIVAAAFPNVGRDIGPMIAGFGGRLALYDIVMHMHSKKSDHTVEKRDWAVQMGHNLLASRGHAISMLELFTDRPELGLIFPIYHISVRKQIRWGANFKVCQQLMARMGARLIEADLPPFPAGSFFAIRGEVLRPLLAGEIKFSDFDPEAGQVDGTMAHGIERLFSILCRHMGYEFLQIRAAKPYSLASVVLDEEPYRSARLQAFRTETNPILPISNAPDGVHVTVLSGGSAAQPLPYEQLIKDGHYVFCQNDASEGCVQHGHWTLIPMPAGNGQGWIPTAIDMISDTGIVVWIHPDIAVVDDISTHIAAVLTAKKAGGAFHHPNGSSLQAEIQRLEGRHPASGIAARMQQLISIEQATRHSLPDTGLIVLDLRHAKTRSLLKRWQAVARELDGLAAGQDLAFGIACAREDLVLESLTANGVGLRADPRLRHFGLQSGPHSYQDVMPRLASFAHSGKSLPTAVQRAAMALQMEVIVLVCPTSAPDSVALTLQRLGSLADPHCRCIIARVAGANVAADAIIDDHLSRHPTDVATEKPVEALRADLVMVLTPGMLLTHGVVQALAEAAIADPKCSAFMPLVLSGLDETNGIWSGRLATQCRRAADLIDIAAVDRIVSHGFLPIVVRRDMAQYLLSGAVEKLNVAVAERVVEISCALVLTALVLVPSRDNGEGYPKTIRDFLKRIATQYGTSTPTIAPVAFYLPQFHPFAVNDRLWGAGFTEWRNVVRAKPRFAGHHQPRLPGDLGYYDLRTADTLRAQGELADLHGLHGMAVYYYRFGEQRLMDEPTDLLLADASIPLRFFYCWANEDWTRAWDGRSDDVNLKQDYSPKTLSLILNDLIRACSDSRYIRVGGKPVFMIYQLNKLPDPRAMLQMFRDGIRQRLGIEICLGTTYNSEFRPDWEELVDFIAQFPPHRTPRKEERELLKNENKPQQIDPARDDFFEHYTAVCRQSLDAVDMYAKLQPGICADWDNSPRREHHAHILVGATLEAFGDWTRRAALATSAKLAMGELQTPLLFVNAWNEWAEGAVLEPYEDDGRATLNAFSGNLPWAPQ
jgi:lipopolysaccharide biosynthesis protein